MELVVVKLSPLLPNQGDDRRLGRELRGGEVGRARGRRRLRHHRLRRRDAQQEPARMDQGGDHQLCRGEDSERDAGKVDLYCCHIFLNLAKFVSGTVDMELKCSIVSQFLPRLIEIRQERPGNMTRERNNQIPCQHCQPSPGAQPDKKTL